MLYIYIYVNMAAKLNMFYHCMIDISALSFRTEMHIKSQNSSIINLIYFWGFDWRLIVSRNSNPFGLEAWFYLSAALELFSIFFFFPHHKNLWLCSINKEYLITVMRLKSAASRWGHVCVCEWRHVCVEMMSPHVKITERFLWERWSRRKSSLLCSFEIFLNWFFTTISKIY